MMEKPEIKVMFIMLNYIKFKSILFGVVSMYIYSYKDKQACVYFTVRLPMAAGILKKWEHFKLYDCWYTFRGTMTLCFIIFLCVRYNLRL